MQGLNINRLIRTSLVLSPKTAPVKSFGVLLLVSESDVISPAERMRTYTDLDSVAGDFGTSSKEYKSASLYFMQRPAPATLMIGRSVKTPTSALVRGATLSIYEKDINVFTAVTKGTFTVSVNGVDEVVKGVDLSKETNLNGVVTKINEKATSVILGFDGSRFSVKSIATGSTATISYLSTGEITGQDLSTLLKLNSESALKPEAGSDAETTLDAVKNLDDFSGDWYGMHFCTKPSDAEIINVAGYIEGASNPRVLGITLTDSRVLDAQYKDDLGSQLKALGYRKTFIQYSSAVDNACVATLGRYFTVNFNGNKTVINPMWKQDVGVVAENITESQAQALKAKNVNVFVAYQNGTAIIQYGQMSGDAYFDEVHGGDWLKWNIQNAVWNLFYTSNVKIPQTEAGQQLIYNAISMALQQGIANGLIAEGTWNSDGFGQLQAGDLLKGGYYIYVAPLSTQSQSEREKRVSNPFQIAVKLAGAMNECDILITANR